MESIEEKAKRLLPSPQEVHETKDDSDKTCPDCGFEDCDCCLECGKPNGNGCECDNED